MAKMVNANFKLVGRCHPWCGNQEYLVGKAAEKREWMRDQLSDDIWDARSRDCCTEKDR